MKDFLKSDESLFGNAMSEGFIEITAMDELDKMVGGFLNYDENGLELYDGKVGSWPENGWRNL